MCDYENDCGDNTDEEVNVCLAYTDRCDFENNFCRWIQGDQDSSDWTVIRAVS